MLHNTTDAELCAQARREIIAASLKNGGHLASNLGAVELTVALHRVFQPARDRIVWDVGHQCYTHKWLTGRDISKIRTSEGPSGFPKPAESETDAFATGHASTAISAALGMARARDLQGEDYACIAVVGDGALTGGMCYEALCDAGASKTPLIIIINDNRMSISQSTGAMHEMLTRMRASRGYHRAKRSVEFGLQRIPLLGKPIARCIKWFKNIVGRALLGDTMFDDMGLVYLGPIDGHNIREMQLIFRRAAALSLPVIVHVCTVKGLGYGAAESDPEDYHGVDPRKMTIDNAQCTINKLSIVNSALLVGNWLCERAVNDEKIVAITAAMCKGCGLTGFAAQYPNRFFDVGICEEHAVTMAAGMAMGGLRPVVCVYSTFLQRGVDQLLHDVCL
ncbi:MAG: 1-deoxy-D-xylulose-5-phosphate synthase, partial [Clostridia bacterium]|nr:1-deoxy-D-xylulose-5-phosphate synthase [Clostridia bacterium]